jgi:signal peptidase
MIWKSLMLITQSESPIVVVLSGSMEPAYQRGDILFLTHLDQPLIPGIEKIFILLNFYYSNYIEFFL